MKTWVILVRFMVAFIAALAASAAAGYAWSLIRHGAGEVDWEASFRLAIIVVVAVVLTSILQNRRKGQHHKGGT